MTKYKYFLAIASVIILFGLGLWWWFYPLECRDYPQSIIYRGGDNPGKLYQNLVGRGCYVPRWVWVSHAKVLGARNWQAGEYLLDSEISLSDFMLKLRNGKRKFDYLTIVPGDTLGRVRARFRDAGLPFPVDYCYKSKCEDGLWPDSYAYTKYDPRAGQQIIKMAQVKFRTEVAALWGERDYEVVPWHDVSEALRVAALLELESDDDRERRLIAGVIMHRLELKMPLQIDASVRFALEMDNKWRGHLNQHDYQYPSPYNTYLHKGLPPVLIGYPSRRSLQAALHPIVSNYLYYRLDKKSGKHKFFKSFSEHRDYNSKT